MDRSRRDFLLTSTGAALGLLPSAFRHANAIGKLLFHEKNSELFFFRPRVDEGALQKLVPDGFRVSRPYVDVIAGVRRVVSPKEQVIFYSGINAYVKDGNGRDGWFRPYTWYTDGASRPGDMMRNIFGRGALQGTASFNASETKFSSETLNKEGEPVLSMSVELAPPREDAPFWRHSKDIFSVKSQGGEVTTHHTIVDYDAWRDFAPETAQLSVSKDNANLLDLKLGEIEDGWYVRQAVRIFAPVQS